MMMKKIIIYAKCLIESFVVVSESACIEFTIDRFVFLVREPICLIM